MPDIAPDEIFLDSSNLPGHNAIQFEGRVVQALSNRTIIAVGLVFCLVVIVFAVRAFSLEVVQGAAYADISRNNTLDRTVVFATTRPGARFGIYPIPESRFKRELVARGVYR